MQKLHTAFLFFPFSLETKNTNCAAIMKNIQLDFWNNLDDEGSTSSTITVNDQGEYGCKLLSQRGIGNSSKPTKRVGFDLERNTVHYNSHCLDAVKCTWYTRRDYLGFREQNVILTQKITDVESQTRLPCSYARTLTRTYDACCEGAEDISDEAYSVLDESEMARLQRWLRAAITYNGLEKYAIEGYREERRNRVDEVVESVLGLQDLETDDQEDLDEFIRMVSERLTRPSRTFARTMAEAHAASFLEECNEEVMGRVSKQSSVLDKRSIYATITRKFVC